MDQKKSELEFKLVSPRHTVEVYLQDGRVLQGPRNAPVGDFFRALPEANDPPIVGAIVNSELRELTYKIKMDSHVNPVTMGDADGMRIYRRSLIFLLEATFDKKFPDAILKVEHSVSSGGYYCRVVKRPSLSERELADLEKNMKELVDLDIPFQRKEIPLSEAITYFQRTGKEEKVRLLAHRQKDYLTIYQLNDFLDYHHGYMLPSTGYLQWFQLVKTGEDFTLRFPRRHEPTKILPLPDYPKLLNTFRQYSNWLERLGIASVGALNDVNLKQGIDEVILVSEALHEQYVSMIANQITNRINQVRVVMVAGPSASGKTTFSKRLSIQLLARGIAPFPLAMDNYFIDRDKTPLDYDGQPDFESIHALDRDRMVNDIRLLIRGDCVKLPHYNFLTGKSDEGGEIQLKLGEIIILEGIHGLNPDLVLEIPAYQTFRIYVSALTQLNLDWHNRISTTDTRLIRRIVRDARERGYSAFQTIQRWESVRRGEKRYIFPFQENADIMFNSALAYELSALKPLAEPLLRQVPYGIPEYVEAKRLLALLQWFLPLDSDLIPDNSILREFIGSSILRDFTIWPNHQ